MNKNFTWGGVVNKLNFTWGEDVYKEQNVAWGGDVYKQNVDLGRGRL